MAAAERIELAWRSGAWAAVWKVAGVPLGDGPDSGGGQAVARGGRPPPESVCAWASKCLDGAWSAVNRLGTASAGLVLLARKPPERFAAPVRGTYALLVVPSVAPGGVALAEADAPEVTAVWESLGLFGGMDEDGARLAQEAPSGHFGRVALVEIDVPLTGDDASTPLQLLLELQRLGFSTLQLAGPKGSDIRNPQMPAQEGTQADVLPGTCLALVAIRLPAEALAASARATRPSAGFSGVVEHAAPGKFAKVLAAESAAAEQRRRPADGLVVFRGLKFAVPDEQLRPRAASAPLVDAGLAALAGRQAAEAPRVLDLGVGCGALLLALLHDLGPGARGTGLDIDASAVSVCRENAARVLGQDRAASVDIVLGDFGQLHTPALRAQLLPEGYDLIVCNPPYRSEEQQQAYDAATGQFGGQTEHAKTLVAGQTGLELYEAVAASLASDADLAAESAELAPLLRPGGTLIFQVEAGSRGRLGGVAARVGEAVERAAGGRLRVRGVHADDQGLERAILVESVRPAPSGQSRRPLELAGA